MTPALIHLHNLKPTFIRETEVMHVQATLYSRSTLEANSTGGSGGVETNTIIFIVVGVVCLFVILIGFYLVSRPRAAPNVAPSIASSPPQHSPISHPPQHRHERGMNEYWKIWRIWRRTSSINCPTTADTPNSQVLPASATIISQSRIMSARDRAGACPTIASRPSQGRRITSLSVTTSFSHSHITEEELNNFRLSAYDLDGDLETEMLNSARDEVWPGQPLAMEEGCGSVGVEEAIETRGNATSVEGSVEGYVPSGPTTQWRGGDYENLGACQGVASCSKGIKGDVIIEVESVAMGRQALQQQC